jgi:hypothetical protein
VPLRAKQSMRPSSSTLTISTFVRTRRFSRAAPVLIWRGRETSPATAGPANFKNIRPSWYRCYLRIHTLQYERLFIPCRIRVIFVSVIRRDTPHRFIRAEASSCRLLAGDPRLSNRALRGSRRAHCGRLRRARVCRWGLPLSVVG